MKEVVTSFPVYGVLKTQYADKALGPRAAGHCLALFLSY